MRLTEFLHQVNKYTFLIERDVLNAGEVKKMVMSISGRVHSAKVQKWFQSQLYQFLINRYNDRRDVQVIRQAPPGSPDWLVQKLNAGEAIYNVDFSVNVSEKVMPVVDYINAWSEDNPEREPRMRWEQAEEQSQEWHKEMQNVSVSAEENEQDLAEVVTVYEFKNGYRWVDVNTEVCLKREGNRMGHCVGGYGKNVASGTTKILSLRDSKNIPHATIEATSEGPVVIAPNSKQRDLFHGEGRNLPQLEINQVKGRGNKVPVAKYIPYIKEFMEWGDFSVSSYGASDIEKMGLYKKGGEYLPLKDVSKTFIKYKDGDVWVRLDRGVEIDDPYNLSTGSNTPYKLVDSGWNIKADAKTTNHGEVKTASMPYGFTKKERQEVRPKVLDLLNKAGSTDEYGGLRSDWEIFHHNGKHGDLHEVAKKLHDLPNGNKIVEATKNYFVLNDKDEVVFEIEYDIGDISIDKKSFVASSLNMNYGELVKAVGEATGEEISNNTTSVRVPLDWNGNEIKPAGEVEFEQDGISWHVGGEVPAGLSKNLDSENLYIGYDKHKNPLYYIITGEQKKPNQPLVWHPDRVVEDVGMILGGTNAARNYNTKVSKETFKPGYDILNMVLEEKWDTTGYDFVETMYEEFLWIEGDGGYWWMADDAAPATYTEIEYNEEDEQVFENIEENVTLDTFFTNTSLHDSGADIGLFRSLYVAFFDGNGARWDDRELEREDEDPETGEGIVVYYSMDYEAVFTGDNDDYKHPKS